MRWLPRYSLRTLAVFMLLVTSAGWFWWHWEAWYCQEHLDRPLPLSYDHLLERRNDLVHWHSGDQILITRGKGGPRLAVVNKMPRQVFTSDVSLDCRRIVVATLGGHLSILDTREGTMLCQIARGESVGWQPRFLPKGDAFIVADFGGKVQLWRRRRPEWWWGVFYLREFWVTIAFAGLFVWSLWRDRAAFRRSFEWRPGP